MFITRSYLPCIKHITMNELIKITDQDGKRAVSARELYAFLESKRDFSNWIKDRIEKYGFIENQDFERFNKSVETGGRLIEYALTIDCAKEIAMVEGNDKGKQARQYFIECEKLAKNPSQHISRKDLAIMVLESEKENERLQIQNRLQTDELRKQAPKIEYVNQVLQSESTYNTNQIAKELGMSAISLNKVLKDRKIQYKQNGTWLLYHNYQSKGFTKTKTHIFTNSEGAQHTSMLTVWTELGRAFIHKVLKQMETA